MNKTMLIYRDYDGLGDWIMAMSVIKMVNLTYPNINVYVRHTLKNRGALPYLIRQIINGFDCKIHATVYNNSDRKFDYVSGHLVYRRNERNHFVRGMIDVLNERTRLSIDFDSKNLSNYIGNAKEITVPKKYILMHSGGKRQSVSRSGKDWGTNNFNKLAYILSKNYEIVQIGKESDEFLNTAKYKYLGVDLSTLHYLMSNCLCFIGISDGLSVYAGHHNINQFTVFCNEQDKYRNTYKNQVRLNCFQPNDIAYLILKELEKV